MSEHRFFSLEGQVAVVTGAGQGIGEGIARRLAEAGARVAVFDIHEAAAQAVAKEIKGIGVRCDVSSMASIRDAVGLARRRLGAIDIVVNNAGIAGKTAELWEL